MSSYGSCVDDVDDVKAEQNVAKTSKRPTEDQRQPVSSRPCAPSAGRKSQNMQNMH